MYLILKMFTYLPTRKQDSTTDYMIFYSTHRESLILFRSVCKFVYVHYVWALQ